MSGLGLTQQGLEVALEVRDSYRQNQPICLPGDEARILVPETLLNQDLDLHGFEDPLPLAVVGSRDPEAPMALAAAARMSEQASSNKLIGGVFELVGEFTKHAEVRRCIEIVTESAFDPRAIAGIRKVARRMAVHTRQEYTVALRRNLKALIEGVVAPRDFVHDFFTLTEAGNLRHDIRKRLVLSLLLSSTIRPSIKFMILENFHRLPRAVRLGIVAAVLQAEPTRHTEIIKEELRWLIQNAPEGSGFH